MVRTAIVLDGVLKPDGTVQLDAPPRLPPGRVRVTLQRLEEPPQETARLPDAPWIDESVPAPCDLPRPAGTRIEPRAVNERLPEPPQMPAEDAR